MSSKQGLALVFSGYSLLYEAEPLRLVFPLDNEALHQQWQSPNYLEIGQWQGQTLWAVEIAANNPLLDAHKQIALKRAHDLLPDDLFPLALRGLQLLHWQRHTRFCGACGHALYRHQHELTRVCPVCAASYYPKYAPAIIVRITRGSDILLARSAHFVRGMHSHIAGFIEPGESAEDAIHREVDEEVSLKVKDIRYFGSQPWPFPDSYMLAFTAEYESGDIQIDPQELTDAHWFARDSLPELPKTTSIARRLLDDYLKIA